MLAALGIVGIAAQAGARRAHGADEAEPLDVAAHFLLSMALIAVAVALLERDTDAGDAPRSRACGPRSASLGRVLVGLAVVVLTLGTVVTGSGPHSGDADEPARFGFDPRSVSWLHADAVLLFIGLLVAVLLALHLTDAAHDITARAWFLAFAVLVQGAIGYVQYFTGLPVGVVALHIVGACLVWFATLRLCSRCDPAASLSRRPTVPARETPAAAR